MINEKIKKTELIFFVKGIKKFNVKDKNETKINEYMNILDRLS